jgi:hypothetical protein
VAFGADEVRFDARAQALEIVGHVHVDEPPFHLTGEAMRLRRVAIGAQLDGAGKLSFCPCLSTPLAVRFQGATVAPPDDLILRQPVLEVFGVPVAWAPVFWLRSAGRFGVLAPDIEWRGADGLLLGEGIHVPWVKGDTKRGLDLRAAGYVEGGAAVDATLQTTLTVTRVQWDELRGDDGILVAAHGATSPAPEAPDVAWSVDALRGGRAVRATTDVDAAARPFDAADADAAWRSGGWTFAAGFRDAALRGGDLSDLGAGGPVVVARTSEALARAGSYDATLEGGAVSEATVGTTTFARGEGGMSLASRLGSVGATVAARGLAELADDGTRSGLDGAAQARASLGLPLARGFGSTDPDDPWVHRTEPRIEAAALVTRVDDVIVIPSGRGMTAPEGGAWVLAADWDNALGRWGARDSAELDASAGVVGDGGQVLPAVRARAAASATWVGLRADFARVLGSDDAGGAFVARARIGPTAGPHVAVHVAERDGIDPVVARTLVDAPLEPASGFLATPGWTGGARVAVPIGPRITTRAGADVDLGASQLVAALGALELHDPCGCVVVRATAAHRIGRDGVDVWLTVDLPR